MSEVRVPPTKLRPIHYEPIERQLLRIFYEIIFLPLVDIVTDANIGMKRSAVLAEIRNAAPTALLEALRKGQIRYKDGVFSGKMSSAISAALEDLGAKYDRKSKTFKMPAAAVPLFIREAVGEYEMTAREAHKLVKEKLEETQKNLQELVKARHVEPGDTLAEVEKDFRTVAQKIQVTPTLTPAAADRLKADYQANMNLWIQKFSEETIGELRRGVEANAMEGYRFERLVDLIRNRYAVTENKARFLARQETGLFMSKYRQQRFKEAGVRRYRWSTAHDARVRPEAGVKNRANNHRVLDGRIFYYDDPPIVDSATGRKANPGEDYNCRCVDIPILEPAQQEAA